MQLHYKTSKGFQ